MYVFQFGLNIQQLPALFRMHLCDSSLSPMFSCSQRRQTVRAKFTKEEDAKLRELVALYGEAWPSVAVHMPGRCIRQCKERWYEYLDPKIIKRDWTSSEDNLLIQKVSELGRRWISIRRFFPGRTSTSLKNRFNRLCRRVRRGYRMYMLPSQPVDSFPYRSDAVQAKETEEDPHILESEMDELFLDWNDIFLD